MASGKDIHSLKDNDDRNLQDYLPQAAQIYTFGLGLGYGGNLEGIYNLPPVLALAKLLKTVDDLKGASGEDDATSHYLAASIQNVLKEVAGSHKLSPSYDSNIVPYIQMAYPLEYSTTDENLDTRSNIANIDMINKMIGLLSEEWNVFPQYFFYDGMRKYDGGINLTEKEMKEMDVIIAVFMRNQKNPDVFLRLKTNAAQSAYADLSLTVRHPDFIQGVHDLKEDFQIKDTYYFADLLESLENRLFEKSEKVTVPVDKIYVVECADWHGKIES